jgi:hypothetical protein
MLKMGREDQPQATTTNTTASNQSKELQASTSNYFKYDKHA